ncbi:hypothetical protein [Proteiniphilum saccharofermentans]|uniref:hypothetical protein n=1 Tax=Proteiniphilum saccharofermentans TaxID=1642647 RepID=UPI0028AB5DDE|nr:hypothetical protein [Proteiniphilum saccharofermentans]
MNILVLKDLESSGILQPLSLAVHYGLHSHRLLPNEYALLQTHLVGISYLELHHIYYRELFVRSRFY